MAHLLPLGPKGWQLNAASGVLGMAFFFNLSGFLITATLLYQPSVRVFAIRRLCRILPLLWLFLLVMLPLIHAPWSAYLPSFLCYANLPPFPLTPVTDHLWSIGVEVQFYVFIAVLFAVAGKRGFYALPVLAVLVTAGRVWTHDPVSIVTIRRVDDILTGAVLLMLTEGMLGTRVPLLLSRIPFLLWLVLTVFACMEQSGPLQYLRPYLAMCLLGSVLFQPAGAPSRGLQARWLLYLAGISYALYVIHGGVFHLPWFDDENQAMRRLKRPLGLLLVWALAHLSSKYYEAFWVGVGRRWSGRLLRREPPATA